MSEEVKTAAPVARPLKQSRLRTVACWLCNILAVTGAVLLIYHGCFDLSLITSPSMKPTLKGDIPHGGNDWVLTERVSYWFRKPKRWEVVRFFDDEGNQVM
jgi:signal peptidase I